MLDIQFYQNISVWNFFRCKLVRDYAISEGRAEDCTCALELKTKLKRHLYKKCDQGYETEEYLQKQPMSYFTSKAGVKVCLSQKSMTELFLFCFQDCPCLVHNREIYYHWYKNLHDLKGLCNGKHDPKC